MRYAEFCYKCDDFYRPDEEGDISCDDSAIGIIWPEIDCEVCLSEKDKLYETLKREEILL
jgi:dTDP-4-dehydrorhamnose 3,5-epimerase